MSVVEPRGATEGKSPDTIASGSCTSPTPDGDTSQVPVDKAAGGDMAASPKQSTLDARTSSPISDSYYDANEDVVRMLDIDGDQSTPCAGDIATANNIDASERDSGVCDSSLNHLVSSSGDGVSEKVSKVSGMQNNNSEYVHDRGSIANTSDTDSYDESQELKSIEDDSPVKSNRTKRVTVDGKASTSDVQPDASLDEKLKLANSVAKTPSKNNKENASEDILAMNTSVDDATENEPGITENNLGEKHSRKRKPRTSEPSEEDGNALEAARSILREKLLQASVSKESNSKDVDDDDDIDILGFDLSQDDFEVVATPPSRKKQKKRKSITVAAPQDQTIPPSVVVADKYYKPFELDWAREIVIRNTYEEVTPSGKLKSRPADVYYFTPEKKKLRSMVQITDFLYQTNSPLTIDNFTFQKDPIYKDPFEIVRMAGSHRRGKLSTTGKSPQPSKHTPKKQKASPKTPVTTVITPVIVTPARIIKKTPTIVGKVVTHADIHSATPPAVVTENKPVIRAVAKKHTGKRGPTKPLESFRIVMSPPPLKKAKVDDDASRGKGDAERLCGMDCPGRQGVPPSLHCEMCMCMFHPECVGYSDRAARGGFICKACRAVSSSLQDKQDVNGRCSTPGTPIIVGAPPPPPLVRAPTASTPSIIKMSPVRMRVNSHESMAGIRARISLSQPKSAALNGISGAPAIRLVTPPKDSSQVSGQLLTLPPGVTTKLNLKQPLQLRMGGNTFVIPPSCFISTANSVKVLLPPGCLSQGGGAQSGGANKALNLNVSASSNAQEISINSVDMRQLQPPPQLQPSPQLQQSLPPLQPAPTVLPPQLQAAPQQPQMAQRRTAHRASAGPVPCCFMRLHVGFDCMMHIFRYLSVADLLRAGRVCRTWRNVVSHSSLWRTVRLAGLKVVDWHHATLRLQCHGTQTLDLRGIGHCDGDINRTWHQVTEVLGQLTRLQHLVFGQCPATVLHTVTHFLTQLLSLEAEFISDDRTAESQSKCCSTKLDVGKFSKLKDLRALKLRGTNGLTLPAFSFTGGLTQLAGLTQLETLCLTTLRDVPHEEFDFLGSLINLQELHLGDCSSWTSETYAQLGRLEKLTVLKLMSGGDNLDCGLGEALNKLPCLEQLELIEYVISEDLADVLKCLTQLRTFSVWTNTEIQASEVNTRVLKSVSQMTFLKQFEWGVTCENVDDISTVATPGESSPPKKKQCIAVLPSLSAEPQPMFDAGSPANFISINKVVEYLCGFMPSTNIRVFQVPSTRRTA